jgi:hypothetical protein
VVLTVIREQGVPEEEQVLLAVMVVVMVPVEEEEKTIVLVPAETVLPECCMFIMK